MVDEGHDQQQAPLHRFITKVWWYCSAPPSRSVSHNAALLRVHCIRGSAMPPNHYL